MADVTGASLSPILGQLSGVEPFHPLEADLFSDWSVEAGDVVTVTRDNNSYKSPVHSSVINWKKAAQVSILASGNEARKAIAKESQRKFTGGGGGGLRNAENAYYAIETSYNGMRSGLILASSSASLYVENMYKQMKAGLDLTSSSASLYVDSKYNQMKSGLDLTSSSATLYVDNKYRQMKAGLDLTSSSAHLYVDSKYNQMSAGLKLTSSSASLYAGSKENAAQIVARINQSTGESEIQLDANKVYIGNQRSTTVINGKCSLSDVTADYINAKLATLPTLTGISATFSGNVSAAGIIGTGVYVGSGSSTSNLAESIKLIQVVPDGNNYILQYQKFSQSGWINASTFSRAIASWTMGWSSGTFTAKANPQNQSCSTTIVQGTPTWDGNTVTIPIEAYDSDNPGYQYATGRSVLATHSITSLGIYDVNSSSVSSQTLNRGSSIDLWAGYWDGNAGKWIWGSRVTISAQGNPSYNYSFKCAEATASGGGMYKYTFEYTGTSGSFSAGSYYGFWRG